MDKKIITRREFLREVSVLAGSSVLVSSAPWMAAFADENGKNNSASDRVRVGFIGVGTRGKALLLNAQQIQNLEVVAVCDNYQPNYERALALTGNKAQGFIDYRKMLELKNLDAVFIATPLHEHAHMTIESLQSGVHVYCEKAMARNLEDCKKMVNMQKETGLVLQIGHQRMFNPVYLTALEKIKAGGIGQVAQIRAYWHRNDNWRRETPSPALERKINWRLYKEYSGGLLTELASHQIQVANWFADSVPTQVMGTGSIAVWKDGREVHDNIELLCDYDNGSRLIYDAVTFNRHHGLEEQIIGTEGVLELEQNRFFSEQVPKAPGIRQLIHNIEERVFDVIPIGGASWVPETATEYAGTQIAEYDNNDTYLSLLGFAKSVKSGKPYKNLLREGYHASIGALLGLHAIEQNKVVAWPKEFVMRKELA